MNEEKKSVKEESNFGWKEALWFTVVMITILTFAAAGTATFSSMYAAHTCPTLQAMNTAPGFTYQWGFWTGCRVHIPSGLWVPQSDLDKYIAADPPLNHLPKELPK
jgi:hypothetical protein